MLRGRRSWWLALVVLFCALFLGGQVATVRGQASELFVGRPCSGQAEWGTTCGNALDNNTLTWVEGAQGGDEFISDSGGLYQLASVMVNQHSTGYAREMWVYGYDAQSGSWQQIGYKSGLTPGVNELTLQPYNVGYSKWRLTGHSSVSPSAWLEVRGYGGAYVPGATQTAAAATAAAQTAVAHEGGAAQSTQTAQAQASSTAQSVATFQALGGVPCGWGSYPPCHVYWQTPGPVYLTGTVTISGSVSINNWPATATPIAAQETAVAAATMGVGSGTNLGASGGGVTEYGNMGIKWLKLQRWDMGCPIDLKDWNTKICIIYDEVTALSLGTFDVPVLPMGLVTLSCLILQMVRRR